MHETALVEVFNLKAAIEWQMRNVNEARMALTDMPPRAVEELDPVTLHNLALVNMGHEPSASLEKLEFLLQHPSQVFPHETFANLLIEYIHLEQIARAADLVAERPDLANKLLSPVRPATRFPFSC